MLLARYHMSIMVTADFLKTLEKLAWTCGASREQFDHLIFAKGVDTITEEIDRHNDEDLDVEMAMIAPLGSLARERGSRQ